MNKVVYLCGGINGLSDAAAKDWRDEAKARLQAAGLESLDPMRRDYRGRESLHVSEIIKGDLEDIDTADVLLVNAFKPSWGTAMELMYAAVATFCRPMIVAFGANDQPSPWLVYYCDKLFPTLAEALDFLTDDTFA